MILLSMVSFAITIGASMNEIVEPFSVSAILIERGLTANIFVAETEHHHACTDRLQGDERGSNFGQCTYLAKKNIPSPPSK